MSYDNTNRGAIWRNERKYDEEGNLIGKETDPDFTGSADIDGVDHWVNAWKRKPDAAPKAPALSFTFKRKEAAQPKPVPAARQSALADDFREDSIPF